MSSTTFQIFRCDRCGDEETISEDARRPMWGIIAARRHDEKARIGPGDRGDDLCPSCIEALFAWYATPAGDPPPPPPPSPPPAPAPSEPLLNPEQRGVAATRAAALLREQADEAIGAIRDRPTSIVTGETPDAAFAGIDTRATLLVDAIVDQLSIPKRPKKRGSTKP
jgi:hypothetical protein